ncbi:MAG TPA: histidine kinase dimerization/phospho-acceptor domain-containing protein, partial [Xanthomonadaceae bacterium]|nr:histidine kinase dimerization/phospho-acceptor domain-containing protein [Xanthomonadaceae bacterium]
MPFDPAAFDSLATPVAWLDAGWRLGGANPAFGRWLGVGLRRLPGLPLDSLESDGEVLHALVSSPAPADGPVHLRRLPMAFPGQGPARFADVTLSPAGDGGWLLEAHPVAEFPGEDPSQVLPGALAAALRGLAHELRNPLSGLKGAAQLLARRAEARRDNDEERELIALVDSEVRRLATLLDRLMSPAPPRPHEPLNLHAVLERVLRLAEN